MLAALNGHADIVKELLAKGANKAGGFRSPESEGAARASAAVMPAWFEVVCVRLVVKTAVTRKMRGFEAQSCPGLRFAPKRKCALRVSSRHDILRASALRETDKMVALCRHELRQPRVASVFCCFRDPLSACPCTGYSKHFRPQPRVALTLRFSGLLLTARLPSKPKPPPSEQTLEQQCRLSRRRCFRVRGTTALMYAARNGHADIVKELLAKGANKAGGFRSPESEGAARASAAVMPAWFDVVCVRLVVKTAVTRKMRGFEAQSCPGLRFAPQRKCALRVSSRHDILRASALRETDKMVALCRHELRQPRVASVFCCFRDALTASLCTGYSKQRRPRPRVALTLRFSGLRLTARLQSKPKPPPSEHILGQQRLPSATMFLSPRRDSPHVGGTQRLPRHRERAPGEGRRQGRGGPQGAATWRLRLPCLARS